MGWSTFCAGSDRCSPVSQEQYWYVRYEAMLRAAELELMTPATRSNSLRVEELLHEDFVEIGRSGRRWTRSELVTSLAKEDDQVEPTVDEWAFVELSRELVLVTYRVKVARAESRHSSLWDVGVEPPRMRLHQGTIVLVGGSAH